MNQIIPTDRQQDVLDVMWQLLINFESKTSTTGDNLDELLIRQSYDLLNDLGFTVLRPVNKSVEKSEN